MFHIFAQKKAFQLNVCIACINKDQKAKFTSVVANSRNKPVKKVKGYWDDINHQRDFLDKLAVKLNVKEKDDWYKVTVKVI